MTNESQSLGTHLDELRRRLTWAAIVVVIFTAIAFIFHQQILRLLMEPASGFPGVPNQKPVYTDLTEFIGIAMKASLLAGIFTSLPFLLWQLTMFVSPGLNSTEKKYLYILMPVSVIIFVLGAAFGYFVLFPPAVKFLITFGSDVATPMIRIGNYVSLMLSLLFWMGAIFELPIVLFFLSYPIILASISSFGLNDDLMSSTLSLETSDIFNKPFTFSARLTRAFLSSTSDMIPLTVEFLG